MILKNYSTYAVLLKGFEELGTFKITNMGFLGMLPGLHNSWLQIKVVTPLHPEKCCLVVSLDDQHLGREGGFLAFQGLVLLELVFQIALPGGKSSASFMSKESEVVFRATRWMS